MDSLSPVSFRPSLLITLTVSTCASSPVPHSRPTPSAIKLMLPHIPLLLSPVILECQCFSLLCLHVFWAHFQVKTVNVCKVSALRWFQTGVFSKSPHFCVFSNGACSKTSCVWLSFYQPNHVHDVEHTPRRATTKELRCRNEAQRFSFSTCCI